MKEVVHGLRAGAPLCGFSKDLPRDWPPGHKWAHYLLDTHRVTCDGCKKEMEKVQLLNRTDS